MYQKKVKHFYSCSAPNNNFFSNYQHLVVVFTVALSPSMALPSTHYYWHISQIIITLKDELLLSKCNCVLTGSYPLSPPFPFDHNYTCRRVKWGEHGGMGPMQHSLTTAIPFKSQKTLFKARALGSNLIHRRLRTYQLPILDPPSPVTWFALFVSCPSTSYGLPPPHTNFAMFCNTRISSNHVSPDKPAKICPNWNWSQYSLLSKARVALRPILLRFVYSRD